MDQIFLGLSICAELHPDPSLSDSEGFPIFAANGAEAQMGAEASANHAMAALLAAGDQIGKPGGPSLSELLGPGWITADSLNAAEGGDEEDMEGDEGEEGEGDEGGDEDAEGAEEDAEDVEGRFEDAEE